MAVNLHERALSEFALCIHNFHGCAISVLTKRSVTFPFENDKKLRPWRHFDSIKKRDSPCYLDIRVSNCSTSRHCELNCSPHEIMANQGSKPQGRQPYLVDRPSGPVAPDQIPFRHILQAVRLKWANALPRRIKWSKRITWVGSPLIPFIGWFWIYHQEEMPISGRRRLNFFAHGIRREWWAAHEANLILATGYVHQILALARTQPGLIWPDDHPTTRVVRTVCNRLVVANGGDPTAWQVYIANALGEPPIGLFRVKH